MREEQNMEKITPKDRERLRSLAHRQMELAHSAENERIMKMWKALEAGRRETPTVRLLFSNFTDEVITPYMECEGETARNMEWRFLWNMVGRELFGDDTPTAPFYQVGWHTWAQPFGLSPHFTRAKDKADKGFHIEPLICDLEEDFDKLWGGSFGVDREGTRAELELTNEIFGDILPVKMTMGCLGGSITNPLIALMGMENYYLSMYDCPDKLHELMDRATSFYEAYYDFLEREKLLLPTTGFAPLAQESYCFTNELPEENVTKTTQCWGFLESQETTAVSPETYGEFAWEYMDRLVKRYGLLSYGCCERVDALWEGYLSKWKNLRKLSVSPFNNEPQIGEYLRGTNVVYYSKPRAEFVTNPGPLDEDALRKYFKMVCESASGCLFEMAQREVGTIYGDVQRGRRYVEIAKECVEQYWKP